VLLGIDDTNVLGSAEKIETKASAEEHGPRETGDQRVGGRIREPVGLDSASLEVHVVARHEAALHHGGAMHRRDV
jgi:hypothetical protein